MARGKTKKTQTDSDDLVTAEDFVSTIKQEKPSKKRLFEPWQVIPHCPLSNRKVTAHKNKKIESEKKQITSLKQLAKTKLPTICQKQLKTRKAIQVDTVELSVSQLIKVKLTDYNSIDYRLKVS